MKKVLLTLLAFAMLSGAAFAAAPADAPADGDKTTTEKSEKKAKKPVMQGC